MSAYILIIVLTFSGGGHAYTSSTIQVEHKSREACETMLKAITMNVTGMNSQVRLSGCYAR